MKIFLGGTIDLNYHNSLINKLKTKYSINIYNETPLEYQVTTNDYWLYIITPKNKDMLSIAQLVHHCNKNSKQVIFVFLIMDGYFRFDHNEWTSLCKIGDMLKQYGITSFNSIKDAVKLIKENITVNINGK